MNFGGVIHLNKTGIVILCTVLFILFIYYISSTSSNDTGSTDLVNLRKLLIIALKAAENGGKEVVSVKDKLKIKSKGLTKEGEVDSVTTADFLSHCSMVGTLHHYFAYVSVISEEANTKCDAKQDIDLTQESSVNLVDIPDELVERRDVTIWIDPLDATHEYTEHLYQFVTTMVCIAVKGKPVIGVIHKPFSQTTSWAWVGKNKSPDLLTKDPDSDKLKITISRSHKGQIEEILQKNFKDYEVIVAAGAGYKALEVAYGHADVYLHSTAIKKWDICAGNAIIEAMGGRMTTKTNENIDYSDEKNYLNENGLVASIKDHDTFIGKL